MPCKLVTEVNHAGLSVCRIDAVRVGADQGIKIRECSLGKRGVTVIAVNMKNGLQQIRVLLHVGEASHVVDIIKVLVGRMSPDEVIACRYCLLVVAVLVIGVDQIELDLLRERAVRVTRIHGLEILDGLGKIAGVDDCLGLLIENHRGPVRNLFLDLL